MELYLLRHAHAGDPAKWHGDDAARPLSERGRDQAARLGALLASAGFRPDLIATSPKLRALETAQAVGDALGIRPRVDDRLASGFDRPTLAALAEDLGRPARLVVVGHDPDFSELLSELVGVDLQLRKGALARVDLDGVGTGAATLRWLVPPDALAPARG